IAPNGSILVSGDAGGVLNLWDVSSKKLISKLREKTDDGTTGLCFTNDGRSLIHGGRGAVHIWDVASRSAVAHWKSPGRPLSVLALSLDGRTIGIGRDSGSIVLCDAATMKEIRMLSGHEGIVNSLAFAPGDKTLASGGYDGKVFLWDAGSWQVRSKLQGGMG